MTPPPLLTGRWGSGRRRPAQYVFRPAGGSLQATTGVWSVALDIDTIDLEDVDIRQRLMSLRLFEEVLCGASCELQFVLHVRRLLRPGMFPGGPAPARALEAHWRRTLSDSPVYARRLIAVAHSEDTGAAHSAAAALRAWLAASGASSTPLTGDALTAVIREVTGGGQWREGARGIRSGRLHLRAMRLARLPGAPVSAGWLAPLLRVEAECDISLRFCPEVTTRSVAMLGRRLRDLGAHRLHEADRGLVPDALVDTGYHAAEMLRRRLAGQDGRPLRLVLTALARGESPGALTVSSKAVEEALAATLSTVSSAHMEHGHVARLCLPVGASPPGAGKLVDSTAAATCIPLLNGTAGDSKGHVLGSDARSGLPIALNLFDASLHSNANVAVVGSSGQGKTFTLSALVIEARRQGVEAIVVDPEGEYQGLVERLGGRWIRLGHAEAAINPFEVDALESDPGWSTVTAVCSALCGGLSDRERAQVERTAAAVARTDSGTTPLMRDLAGALEEDCPRVAEVVSGLLEAPLAGLLGAPTSPHWDLPLIAVGHRDLREDLVPVTTLLLGRLLWQIVRCRPARRHVVVDEAGMLTGHPALRGLLTTLARRCRKYGSSLVVATQNIQDLLRSDDGTVVASNCATVLLGGHRRVEAELMQRTFGLTEAQRLAIETAPRGEFLLGTQRGRRRIRVEVPPEYEALIGGDAKAAELKGERMS